MEFRTLESRVRALEKLSTRLRLVKRPDAPTGQPIDRVSLLAKFEELFNETELMKDEAWNASDHRLALACVRESCHILEIISRLCGELDGPSSTNILNVLLDVETATLMARTYLARHGKLEPNE
jgi:hypothetical protein